MMVREERAFFSTDNGSWRITLCRLRVIGDSQPLHGECDDDFKSLFLKTHAVIMFNHLTTVGKWVNSTA